MMSEGPGAARSSESGADTKEECRGKRYRWQKEQRERHYGSHATRHEWGYRGVDGVHEPQPTADKPAGQDEAKDASGQSDNDLQHIEFRVRGVTLRYSTQRWVERFIPLKRAVRRNCGMRIADRN